MAWVQGDDSFVVSHQVKAAKDAYQMERLRVRRRMASASFVLGIAIGAAASFGGLYADSIAARVDRMATFLAFFLGTLFTFVGAYLGISSYEHRSLVGQTSFDNDRDYSGVRGRGGRRGRENSGQDFGRSGDDQEGDGDREERGNSGSDAEDNEDGGRGHSGRPRAG